MLVSGRVYTTFHEIPVGKERSKMLIPNLQPQHPEGFYCVYVFFTLPKTNSSLLKDDGWKTVLFAAFGPILRGKLALSFREG